MKQHPDNRAELGPLPDPGNVKPENLAQRLRRGVKPALIAASGVAAVTLAVLGISLFLQNPDPAGAQSKSIDLSTDLSKNNEITVTSWTEGTPMPSGVYGFGIAKAPNGDVLILGGTGIVGNNILRLNTSTGEWSLREPSMPTNRMYPTAVTSSVDGKTYVLGGAVNGIVAVDNNEVYDASSKVWTGKAPLPSPRYSHSAVEGSDKKIHVFGGIDKDGKYLDLHQVYDPGTDSWKTLAPISSKRAGMSAAQGSDGDIYLFGGKDEYDSIEETVQRYDPKTNTYQTMETMPLAVQNATAVAVGDNIEVFGGVDYLGKPSPYVMKFNLTTGKWSMLTPLPNAREKLGGVLVDGDVLIIGGIDKSSGQVEVYAEVDREKDTLIKSIYRTGLPAVLDVYGNTQYFSITISNTASTANRFNK